MAPAPTHICRFGCLSGCRWGVGYLQGCRGEPPWYTHRAARLGKGTPAPTWCRPPTRVCRHGCLEVQSGSRRAPWHMRSGSWLGKGPPHLRQPPTLVRRCGCLWGCRWESVCSRGRRGPLAHVQWGPTGRGDAQPWNMVPAAYPCPQVGAGWREGVPLAHRLWGPSGKGDPHRRTSHQPPTSAGMGASRGAGGERGARGGAGARACRVRPCAREKVSRQSSFIS